MNSTICRIGFFVGLTVLGISACTADRESDHENTQIASHDNINSTTSAVLGNLAPPILLADQDRPNWTIQERLQFHKVPGFSIAVLANGELSWVKAIGHADASQLIPVEDNTLFQAASISKPISSLGALKLVEEGQLDLDAPVNDYLKRWKIPDNEFTQKKPVTLRHLLSHTGGLTVHGFPGYASGVELPTDIQILDGVPPSNTSAVIVDKLPGAGFRYSGGGYTILQVLMEDVTGESFPELMNQLVFIPAGMTNSSFVQPLPNLAAPYASVAHDSKGHSTEGHSHRYPEMAAAGLWTTAEDLLKLSIAISGTIEGNSPFLSKEMMQELKTVPSGGEYGLGFGMLKTDDRIWLNHAGSNSGFRAFWLFDESGEYGAALLTNGDNGSALYSEVLSALSEVYDWSYGKSEVREQTILGASEKEEVVGQYIGVDAGTEYEIIVTIENGNLTIKNDPFIPSTAIFMNAEKTGFFNQDGMSINVLYDEEAYKGLTVFGLDFIKK